MKYKKYNTKYMKIEILKHIMKIIYKLNKL